MVKDQAVIYVTRSRIIDGMNICRNTEIQKERKIPQSN